jgi:hypothetical protein
LQVQFGKNGKNFPGFSEQKKEHFPLNFFFFSISDQFSAYFPLIFPIFLDECNTGKRVGNPSLFLFRNKQEIRNFHN